ncbi:SMP-30/gluconolactonase/LRE family protein [Novosphingobium panipatense]|jgi:sugar lactone lactonase YvrE|uniref:SMP-30/gluconolactonase/LRE family protein n=1 Tax=Novosphingobium TaxID=165696 RepID=UPI000CDA4570|nr:SMP-30/gluconolactonase/LRE family protein [Novosphingobium sp. HII-3]
MAHGEAATIETIATGLYLEGLAIDHRRDIIWYSDVIGGGVHGVKPDGTSVTSFNTDRKWTGGVLVNADGAVLSTGEGGIMWNDPDTGRSGWLLQQIDGKPINGVNELAPDGAGGMFFGTIDIEMVIAGKATGPTRIYRLTAEREVILLADIGFSNGIMFDSGRNRFYCNDTFRGTWAFDVSADLLLSNRRLVLEKEDADGMALDVDGNVWITGFRSSAFTRLTSGGSELAPYPGSAGSITQLRFGGEDMRDMYFNVVPADGGDTLKEGGEISARHSFLLRGRSDVPGMKLPPTRFKLG